MNKILSIKSNAIFLAAILVVGTYAAISPSFIIGVNAQYEPQYGMDTEYNSYEPQYTPEYKDKNHYNNYGPDYPPKYTDDRKYNSYKTQYYGMDNNDRKSIGNDNGYENGYDKSQYLPSYKSDYKPAYPLNEKDNREKSKDSISINKVNCVNNNVNINGNNTGDINLGNKGQGYLGAGSSNGGGYGGEGYYDGQNYKKDKGFECIINNNNNNTNDVAGGGNQTIPPGPPQPTTATLTVTKLVTCEDFRSSPENGPTCEELLATITEDQFNIAVTNGNVNPSEFTGSETGQIVTLDAGNYRVTETPDDSIETDKMNLGGNIFGPDPLLTSFTGDCLHFITTFLATGSIAAGESETCNIINKFQILDEGLTAIDSSIIAQGTGDSPRLTALEKIEKLKTQWLELLP